ncbi:MAG TPA: hypothetical protein PKD61_36030, partial [Polyangiaceae bacterium]|nr:hypothetical protein [Polyangiaceae bacterium]
PLDIGTDDPACGAEALWNNAGELAQNDRLVASGEVLSLHGLAAYSDAVRVYNIQVEGSRTYTVSRKLALVHNKPAMRTSQTIGQQVEARINNRKVKLRVDVEVDAGKIQIQSGRGKRSLVDVRIDPTRAIAPQIDEAFGNLPQSVRNTLTRNVERGVEILRAADAL